MSTPRPSTVQPEQWVQEKVETGKQQLHDLNHRLETVLRQRPAAALAAAAGVGYVARTLPIGKLVGMSLRLTLPLVPYALVALGAARALGMAKADPDRVINFPGPLKDRKCYEVCDQLLRGELSAIETYTQAIQEFGAGAERPQLEKILNSHEDSASRLRQHIASMGGEASFRSGVWGGFATALEGAAASLGESPAINVLQIGEEHGIREYEEALLDPDVMDEIKGQIRDLLLPRLREHVEALKALKPA